MSSRREETLDAIQASLQALYPTRLVMRGLQDPAELGDAKLAQGVFAVIAETTSGWAGYVGREAEAGTLAFAIVFHGLPGANASTLQVEQMEGAAEAELLAWCRAIKPDPLDAIYPRRCTYSRGLDAPLAWIAMELEALYV